MDAMTLAICVVLLVGLSLGLRFNFLILYPATIFAAIGAVAQSGVSGDGIGATMLMLALGAVAVQMGYVFGVIMRASSAPFHGREEAPSFCRGPRSARLTMTDSEPNRTPWAAPR